MYVEKVSFDQDKSSCDMKSSLIDVCMAVGNVIEMRTRMDGRRTQ